MLPDVLSDSDSSTLDELLAGFELPEPTHPETLQQTVSSTSESLGTSPYAFLFTGIAVAYVHSKSLSIASSLIQFHLLSAVEVHSTAHHSSQTIDDADDESTQFSSTTNHQLRQASILCWCCLDWTEMCENRARGEYDTA